MIAAAWLCGLALPVLAQDAPTADATQEANFKAYVEMLRKDLKKDKVAIHTELMQLGPDEAAKFWPVYNEFDKAATKLNDERIAYIRMYAEGLGSLTDQKINQIVSGLLDFEARRNQLKRQYFTRMSQTLSVKQAARFLQIETQIERLVDLQVSASLPIVE
jgi:hypothetical protein